MKRFWMRSLTGQLVALMLLALILSQLIFYFIYSRESARAMRDVRRDEFLARAAAVARLVSTTDESLHPEVLRAANTSLSRYWLTPHGPEDPAAWQQEARQYLLRALPTVPLNGSGTPSAPEIFMANPRLSASDLSGINSPVWTPLPDGVAGHPAHLIDLDAWNGFGFAVEIRDGLWLDTVYAKPGNLNAWPGNDFLSVGITAVVLSIVSIIAVRRIGRPLQRLTESAERIGRGEDVEPMPEEGADDIRRTASAFNRMQLRLRRFVEDRTRMIAAISHDLRTPITSLRLRAEFIEDPEIKDKMIATLDEMQAMTESTLTFAREEASLEKTRAIDLDALLESICDDLSEMGSDVVFTEGTRIPWRCRPDALRRALRNVIENAVRYGDRARVSISANSTSLDILVDDDGPGIPESEVERVFSPFVRLENSRNRETGGVGLGLSIARTIVRSHGGDIALANRPGGGLRATIHLPRE